MATEADKQETKLDAKESQEEMSVEFPAPEGWKKMVTSKKGGTPKKNAVLFISPSGEKFPTKRQLEKYLRTHPGSPALSDFDWGTGDTPRRSSRLSEKSKATESPESEPTKKRERKSSSKKGAKEEKESSKTEAEAPKEEGTTAADTEDAKVHVDANMEDAEGKESGLIEGEAPKVEDAVVTDAEKHTVDAEMEDAKGEDNNAEVVSGEVLAGETTKQECEDQKEKNVETAENIGEADNKVISEVPAEKENVAEAASAEAPNIGEEAALKDDTKVGDSFPEDSNQTSLKEEVKVGESFPEDSNQPSLKEEAKVGGSFPEDSNPTLPAESLPDSSTHKGSSEDLKTKDCEAQHQPTSAPVRV